MHQRLSYNKNKAEKTYTAYLAFANSLKQFEVQFREGNDLMAAFKSTAVDSMFFTKELQMTRKSLQPGLVFSPNLDVTRNPEGSFALSANVGFQQFGHKLSNDSLESPYLNERESIKSWIRHTMSAGALLGEVQEVPEGRMFSLQWPKVLTPEITEFRIVVSHDNRIAAMQGSGFDLHDVRYGPADTLKFAPPPWPQLPVITEKEFDPSLLITIVGRVMGMMTAAI